MVKDTDVIHKFQVLVRHLKNPIAKKYLKFGFNIRALQILETEHQLREVIEKAGSVPFSPYETTRINILLNSFYLNILGAVDNLAWVIQYEFDVISGATEKNNKKHDISLFKKKFRKGLNKYNPEIITEVYKFETWFNDIKNFRDPAAHRMPLCCPANVIGPEHKKELDNAQEKFRKQNYSKDRDAYMNAQREMSKVGSFQPIFLHISGEEGEQIYPLSRTINEDYEPFWGLSYAILEVIEERLASVSV
ncbi:Putative uncharacterized protein [Moritella viscosa]|uniref:hypothetical protein n=1 Tax=Moritella viscosa TaxID=80854 RepID=UPI000509181B|nr:hypothetical protein [Moritella viscosa]CED59232.1 putative uncharacterized phage protein [Moritella viscosa]SHO00573.1 Putative uncharacterized protein [Moritella viscosa]SHO20310.1 Putative uncharacterized protein [Moritella viscosa]